MHGLSPNQRPRLLALLLAAALASGCRQEPAPDQNAARAPVTNTASVVRRNPPLDRAALLGFAAQAASAAAAGTALPAGLRGLDGRQFEMRIRFGCRGPSTDDAANWLNWSYDAESRTIRVSARPTISGEDPLIAGLGGEDFEAAEGFWIPRPWLLQPVCPAAAAVESAPAPEPQSNATAASLASETTGAEPLPIRQRVGIAQFFTSTDPRTGRRDSRPYQAVHTLREGQAISSQGFNLVLAGRLRALPGRGVIECVTANADMPPDCVVSAEFQRAWIEQPQTGEVIAQWGGG